MTFDHLHLNYNKKIRLKSTICSGLKSPIYSAAVFFKELVDAAQQKMPAAINLYHFEIQASFILH